MKKITFLFSVLVALAMGVNAQDVGVTDILTPAGDTTIAVGTDMPLTISIKNYGPLALEIGDTIYLNIVLAGQTMFTASVKITAQMVADDEAIIGFGALPLSQVGIPAGSYTFCLATNGTNMSGAMVADANTTNDESCFNLTIGGSSVGEESISQFSAFPNPANNMINVVSPVAFEMVRLFDMAGREVYSFKGTNTNHQINVSNLPVGLYFLSIEAENNKSTKKVSIAR